MVAHKTNKFMAIDQSGNTYHGLTHPRNELAQQIGCHPSSLKRLYMDKTDGTTVHIGYATANMQFRLYEVIPYEDVVEERKAV